jgi:hypothetical protein
MAVIRKPNSLRNIITNILKEEYSNMVLNEITSKEAKEKFYKDIDDKLYGTIISLDPTYNAQKDIMGNYTKWLLRPDNLAKLKTTKEEDFYKIKDDLSKFHKLKMSNKLPAELRDINKFNLDKLLEYIFNNYSDEESLSKSQEIKNIKSEVEKYDFPQWTVIVPKTEEASCYYGKGTRWCTAATDGRNYFDSYNSRGKLWILISKDDPKEKYQLHFEDGQFMDVMDRDYPLSEILNTDDKLFQFFTEKYPMQILEFAIKNTDSNLFSDVFSRDKFTKDQKHDLVIEILDNISDCNYSPYDYLNMLDYIGDLSSYEIRKDKYSDYSYSIQCMMKPEYDDEESMVSNVSWFIRNFGGLNDLEDMDLFFNIAYKDNPSLFIDIIKELDANELFRKYVVYNDLNDVVKLNLEIMGVISDLKDKFDTYPVIENKIARIHIKDVDFENNKFYIELGLKNGRGKIVKTQAGKIDYKNIYNYITNYKLMMDGSIINKPLV